MSTAAVPMPVVTAVPGRKYDRVFFAALSFLMLATVFLGFAKTYFLAGLVHAPLPSWIIHVHGAIFSSWILLLVTQTSLITAGKPRIHMKLGFFGFGLACVMLVFGMMAATNALHRGMTPPGFPLSPFHFYVIPVTDLVAFAAFNYFGYIYRRNPTIHKRLMMLSTVAILDAAVDRWPFAYIQNQHLADLTVYSFIFLIAFYDLFSWRKVQKVTWIGGLALIVFQQVRVPLAMTPPWQAFARFMSTHFV